MGHISPITTLPYPAILGVTPTFYHPFSIKVKDQGCQFLSSKSSQKKFQSHLIIGHTVDLHRITDSHTQFDEQKRRTSTFSTSELD